MDAENLRWNPRGSLGSGRGSSLTDVAGALAVYDKTIRTSTELVKTKGLSLVHVDPAHIAVTYRILGLKEGGRNCRLP